VADLEHVAELKLSTTEDTEDTEETFFYLGFDLLSSVPSVVEIFAG
jgi:hypothetical protein